MADNQKYYYIKLKEDFFETDDMIILQSMPDGYLYSDILMKLYLRSLKYGGKLMFNGVIPYNPQMIATITRHQIGTVEKALGIFRQLGLIEVLENGTIFMMNIQNFIGKSSTEADRVRQYRAEIKEEKERTNVQLPYNECTPKIKTELDIEKERENNTYSGISTSEDPNWPF